MKVILVTNRGALVYKRKMEGELKERTQKNIYIIPTKRKLEENHGDIVKKQRGVKIQKSIDNSRNSSEKEEMGEIQFTNNGWNCGGFNV